MGQQPRSENKRMNDALFEYVTNWSSVKEFDAKNQTEEREKQIGEAEYKRDKFEILPD